MPAPRRYVHSDIRNKSFVEFLGSSDGVFHSRKLSRPCQPLNRFHLESVVTSFLQFACFFSRTLSDCAIKLLLESSLLMTPLMVSTFTNDSQYDLAISKPSAE